MSLDRNLFTLLLTPNATASSADQGVSVVDLIDPSGTVHYRKRRLGGGVYKAELYEPISDSLLGTVTAPSATSKHKTMELYNPAKVVELKFTGTLSFKWSFKWEDHEFEWRREECFIVRKPDPPVLVAVTKEPPGRIKTSSVQILDYNLHRFDIEDRKGLEIVILFALLSFQDSSNAYHDPAATSLVADSTLANSSNSKAIPTATAPPPLPPKPAPKTGVERIAELQHGRGLVNEVSIMEEGHVKDYATYCLLLLLDDAMLFISVRSAEASQVPKVLQVVEEAKRMQYKAGGPELHQYVLYDTQQGTPQKGPRVIKLDDEPAKSRVKDYTPPSSLIVHLSKIDMPELRPRGPPGHAREADPGRNKGKEKTKEQEKGKKKQEDKKRDGNDERVKKAKSSSPLLRRSASPSRGNLSGQSNRPQSQHFQTYPSSHTRTNSHGHDSLGVPLPPPHHTRPPNRQTRSQPAYRQSMYAGWYGHPTNRPPPPPISTAPLASPLQQSSTGFLGRLLGTR